MFDYSRARFEELVQSVLDRASALGATAAAADVSESSGLSVNVRKGKVETIEQTRDKGLGVTVYIGARRGHASTSDFGDHAISETVKAAFEIARFTGEDPMAGLPDPDTLARKPRDLNLFHPWTIAADEAIDIACRMEAAAFAVSPAVVNSEGASVSVGHGHFLSANSLGFMGGFPYSRHSIAVAPIARRGRDGLVVEFEDRDFLPAGETPRQLQAARDAADAAAGGRPAPAAPARGMAPADGEPTQDRPATP